MNFEYNSHGKIERINVKKVSLFSLGLMFKKKSLPLLFDLKKERFFSITSIFCKPFRVILLDKNRKKKRSFDVIKQQMSIPCYGRYLLEVPLSNLDSDEKIERFK